MSSDDKPNELSGEDHSDFVPAVFAPSLEEAERYRDLLNDHDILALVGNEDDFEDERRKAGGRAMTHGVPVLVPEVLLDEASEVIADHEDMDEFQVADEEDDDEQEDDEEFGLSDDLDHDDLDDEDFEAEEEEGEEEEEDVLNGVEDDYLDDEDF